MDLGLRDTEGDLGSFFQLLVVLVLQTGTCGFEVLSSMPSLYKVLLFSSLRLYASDSCRSRHLMSTQGSSLTKHRVFRQLG